MKKDKRQFEISDNMFVVILTVIFIVGILLAGLIDKI